MFRRLDRYPCIVQITFAEMSHSMIATPSHDEVVDAVLAASRAMVAVAVRSLAAANVKVTLPQYRALVVLCYAGEQRTMDLARELNVNSSTATRLIDRLVHRQLATRRVHPDDRRATSVQITDGGRSVVEAVMHERRVEVGRILRQVPAESRRAIVDSLEVLRHASGEAPEQMWSLGWSSG